MVTSALRWLATEFQWPEWASGTFLCLLAVLTLMHAIGGTCTRPDALAKTKTTSPHPDRDANTSLRRDYLPVYCLVMFADWLQGTHMYSLYESYGMDVRLLFLTGFLSSTIAGGIVGPWIDQYGRRRACLIYCFLEIAINLSESIPSLPVLLLGRVLGGISTCLLFSAFESWMVTEHRRRGLDENLLAETFALASEANGGLAIVAGLVAQVAADYWGEIGPFYVAVIVTALAACCVYRWKENYGDGRSAQQSVSSTQTDQSVSVSMISHCRSLGRNVLAVGLCYSLFEGAMYTFVFLWVPTLSAASSGEPLPFGLVFSCFMLCIAIGGKAFDLSRSLLAPRVLSIVLCGLAATSFFVLTVSVGAFSPCAATLRGHYFPEAHLGTTLSVFRFPTNVLVVLGTGTSSMLTAKQQFASCAFVMAVATVCAFAIGAGSIKTNLRKSKTK
ncbi:TPA: hypothetical protein N0F65_001282 [Lagenidium giganteum]|uniref:Molybdate-anion transporter n=1 Tax=Lagenidium giganteum TaxID=4803 RepID=A0AAV2Z2Y6_9STRA|nr:TPA: hypothetical protein N0F65_001282 [Lagenidium giganteum]